MKKPLVSLLVGNNYFQTEKEAILTVRLGKVYVNNQKIIKPKTLVDTQSIVKIKEQKRYVSRAGLKIEAALDNFKINPNGKICLDIGAAEGGFTDCLLQKGANFVYALEKGKNQLKVKLKDNPRVTDLGGKDFADLPQISTQTIDIVVVDVTYAKLEHVLSVLSSKIHENTQILALIKPRFETSAYHILHTTEFYYQLLANIVKNANQYEWYIKDIIPSPIKGQNGRNSEFLALFERTLPNNTECLEKASKEVVNLS